MPHIQTVRGSGGIAEMHAQLISQALITLFVRNSVHIPAASALRLTVGSTIKYPNSREYIKLASKHGRPTPTLTGLKRVFNIALIHRVLSIAVAYWSVRLCRKHLEQERLSSAHDMTRHGFLRDSNITRHTR